MNDDRYTGPQVHVDKKRASESVAIPMAAIIFGLFGFGAGLRYSFGDAITNGIANALVAAFITWLIVLVWRKAKEQWAR